MIRYPSLADFGTHDESAYPSLWEGCVLASCASLGPSGIAAYDFSGHQNPLLIAGDTTPDYLWGSLGGMPAWQFSKYDSGRLETPNLAFDPAQIGQEWTITGWFLIRSYSGSSSFSAVCIGTADYQALTVGLYDNHIIVIHSQNGSNWFFLDSGIFSSLNTLYHFRVCLDRNGKLSFYLDGLFSVEMYCPSLVLNNRTVRIGSHYSVNMSYMTDGYVDDIRFYDRLLTDDEALLLSMRRGIAYEPRPRRRAYSIPRFNPALARQSNVLLPYGVAA